MLWKKLRSTTNPLSNPSVHKQCLRKAKTAELWSGRYTLGFDQEAPLGAFMERADTVHSRKRQTIHRPFFSSIHQLESRKSMKQRKNTDTFRGTVGKSVFSQLSHKLLNQIHV